MEQRSLTGALSRIERACLDGVAQVPSAYRSQVSEMVVEDAWASGDEARFERVVVRHFDTVDGSDPELLLRYTTWLSDQDRSEDVVASAWRALEHADGWNGEDETVLALHRLRTTAALSLWEHAGVGQLRVHALSRDWLTVAPAGGEDRSVAQEICQSSGPASDC